MLYCSVIAPLPSSIVLLVFDCSTIVLLSVYYFIAVVFSFDPLGVRCGGVEVWKLKKREEGGRVFGLSLLVYRWSGGEDIASSGHIVP